MSSSEFRPGAPATDAHSALVGSLIEWRRAERCAVLWFAEIDRRRLYRELGYASIHQYASLALGFSPPRISQFLRLARALATLPGLRAELAAGRLPWTKARVLVAVATPATETRWLDLARREPRLALERRIARVRSRAAAARAQRGLRWAETAGGESVRADPIGTAAAPTDGASRPPSPAETSPLLIPSCASPIAAAGTSAATPGSERPDDSGPGTEGDGGVSGIDADLAAALPVAVSLRFAPLEQARFAQLLEALQKLAARSDGLVPRAARREELVLCALEDLVARARQAAGRGSGCDEPASRDFPRGNCATPYQVIVSHCPTCDAAHLETPSGSRRLAPAVAAAVGCDARMVTSDGRVTADIPPAVRRAVLARDRFRCQAPGCDRRRFLEVHHRVPRARGGAHNTANLVTLCSACHRQRHETPRRE